VRIVVVWIIVLGIIVVGIIAACLIVWIIAVGIIVARGSLLLGTSGEEIHASSFANQ